MKRRFLFAKLHHAVVTACVPDYVGSLTIDQYLLEESGIRPGEAICAFDVDNAARFETYALKGKRGSGEIIVNGASAHLVSPGHRLIILAFVYLEPDEIDKHKANAVFVGKGNRVRDRLTYDTLLDTPTND